MGKLQRHRTAADGSMSTFSSFRGTSGSPKRSFNPDQRIPALADLEFPPPPLDLPPPVSCDPLQIAITAKAAEKLFTPKYYTRMGLLLL